MGKEAFPFTDIGDLRTFAADVYDNDLKWHWDEEDRLVIVKSGIGWQLQYDNELPQSMIEGIGFFIKAGVYHRLIAGETALTIQIIKA